MNARPRRELDSRPGAIDISRACASETRDDGTPNRRSNSPHSFEVTVGSDRESGFNNIDAKAVELPCEPQLFLNIHAATRRLFAITKRGVKNSDVLPIGH